MVALHIYVYMDMHVGLRYRVEGCGLKKKLAELLLKFMGGGAKVHSTACLRFIDSG